jgi:hypothetical protein
MKRLTCALSAAVALALGHSAVRADWAGTPPSGRGDSVPPLNRLLGQRPDGKKWTAEEERLQVFWRDYYRNLRDYYASLESVDWVEYYKRSGYPTDPAFYNPHGINPAAVGQVPVPIHGGMPALPAPMVMPQQMPVIVQPAGAHQMQQMQMVPVMVQPVESQPVVVPASATVPAKMTPAKGTPVAPKAPTKPAAKSTSK